jgi:hypothetical protein
MHLESSSSVSIRSWRRTSATASADPLSFCADSAADRVSHRWRFGRTRETIQTTPERRAPTLPELCCGGSQLDIRALAIALGAQLGPVG